MENLALNFKEPKRRAAFSNNYRAATLIVMALFFFAGSFAQSDSSKYSRINGYGFGYKRMVLDSVFMIPLSTSAHTPYRMGALRYRASDSTLQIWTGYQWNSILTGVGNGVDTAYAFNDSTLAIETPDQDFFVTIRGNPGATQLTDSSFKVGNDTIVIRGTGGGSLDTATVNQLITDSLAAHPPTLIDTTLYLATATVDSITLTSLIGKDPISIESHPYNLNIATTYPPGSNEAWINSSTGGIKFGTSIDSGQTISAIYKYQPVTPFSSIITDLQYVVAASGGTINNGDASFTISSLIGKRIRFYRGQLKQSLGDTGGSYYTFNSGTGEVTISPTASTGELFQFETY